MRALLVTIAVVLSGLAVTNPDRAEYLDWVQHQDQTDPLRSVVMTFARPFVDAGTKVENFTFFSVFTTAIDTTHVTRAVGAMHHFYSAPADAMPWRPGTRSAEHPHIVAAQAPDRWLPEAGYRWINEPPAPGDFRVKWVPGISEVAFPHVVTAPAEGRWLPEDGYDWITQPPTPGDLRVRWMPGKLSTLHDHVVASPQEKRWLPEQGFGWIETPPPDGDFGVRRLAKFSIPTTVSATEHFRNQNGNYCWSIGHCTVCNDADIAEGCGSGYTKDDLRAWDKEMRRIHFWGYVNGLEEDMYGNEARDIFGKKIYDNLH